jgi:acetyltransferase-like isoleucine patch superfamily enzyme
LLAELIGRFRLRHCTRVGRGVRAFGNVWFPEEGEVWLGDRVVLDAREAPIELRAGAGSTLMIGDDTYIGGGTAIELRGSVKIGARVSIGPYCKMLDNDMHQFTGTRHDSPGSTPIVIEDDVTLGERTILLPGAYIGARATVEPGTVVKRRIAAGAIVGGVPARERSRV